MRPKCVFVDKTHSEVLAKAFKRNKNYFTSVINDFPKSSARAQYMTRRHYGCLYCNSVISCTTILVLFSRTRNWQTRTQSLRCPLNADRGSSDDYGAGRVSFTRNGGVAYADRRRRESRTCLWAAPTSPTHLQLLRYAHALPAHATAVY